VWWNPKKRIALSALMAKEPSKVGIAHRFIAAGFGQSGPWSTIARALKHQRVVGFAHPTWLNVTPFGKMT
jgi:hypothetical protein